MIGWWFQCDIFWKQNVQACPSVVLQVVLLWRIEMVVSNSLKLLLNINLSNLIRNVNSYCVFIKLICFFLVKFDQNSTRLFYDKLTLYLYILHICRWPVTRCIYIFVLGMCYTNSEYYDMYSRILIRSTCTCNNNSLCRTHHLGKQTFDCVLEVGNDVHYLFGDDGELSSAPTTTHHILRLTGQPPGDTCATILESERQNPER